jgi:hypothetical protein
VETTVPASQRVTINLSPGMPGQSPWLFQNTQDSAAFATPGFNDASWTPVGIPHGAYAGWTGVSDYYQTAPTNYYAAFWHAHSIGGLSYGFAYDDVNNQSSSIVGAHPEHMAFGISY